MAYFNKVGLLLLSPDRKKFLVCEKNKFTSDFIMPGGKYEEGEDDKTCLAREVSEELNVKLNIESLIFIDEYVDVAAGDPTKDVSIRLYEGKIKGEPRASQEINVLHWLSASDIDHSRLSPIIKNKILPDLIKRKILK